MPSRPAANQNLQRAAGRDLFDSFVFAISGAALAGPKGEAMGLTRRDFVRSACCAAGAFGIATNLSRFGLMHALAQSAPPTYQALVCIFLFGGNDSNNLLIPSDTAGYANYFNIRNPRRLGDRAELTDGDRSPRKRRRTAARPSVCTPTLRNCRLFSHPASSPFWPT